MPVGEMRVNGSSAIVHLLSSLTEKNYLSMLLTHKSEKPYERSWDSPKVRQPSGT